MWVLETIKTSDGTLGVWTNNFLGTIRQQITGEGHACFVCTRANPFAEDSNDGVFRSLAEAKQFMREIWLDEFNTQAEARRTSKAQAQTVED